MLNNAFIGKSCLVETLWNFFRHLGYQSFNKAHNLKFASKIREFSYLINHFNIPWFNFFLDGPIVQDENHCSMVEKVWLHPRPLDPRFQYEYQIYKVNFNQQFWFNCVGQLATTWRSKIHWLMLTCVIIIIINLSSFKTIHVLKFGFIYIVMYWWKYVLLRFKI